MIDASKNLHVKFTSSYKEGLFWGRNKQSS